MRYIISNLTTGVEYNVSEKEWEEMQANKLARKFELVRRLEPKKITIPKEIEPEKSETKPNKK